MRDKNRISEMTPNATTVAALKEAEAKRARLLTDTEIARLHAQAAEMEQGETELMNEIRDRKS